MKSFFRLVLLALFLLVVALVSALTAMRLAIHGHEVAVPGLGTGKSPAAARMIAEQNGLELTVERQYYSPTVPEGKILSQLPPAGSRVRRGWEVRVAESLGPQRVAIPNVIGQSERAANINIRRRGLDVGAIAQMQSPDAPDERGSRAGSAAKRQRRLRSENQFAGRRACATAGSGHAQLRRTASRYRHADRAGRGNARGKRDHGSSFPKASSPMAPYPGSIIVSQNPGGGREGVRRDHGELRSPLATPQSQRPLSTHAFRFASGRL